MVVFINSFEVPAGRVEEFLDGWHATARHLATQPGYVRTRLHRALSPGTHFRVRLRGRMGVSFRLPVSHQQRGVQRWQWAGTVVICAGAGDCAASWEPLAEQVGVFAEVVRFDRPGVGDSEAGPRPSLSGYLADLDAVVEATGADGRLCWSVSRSGG